MNNWFDYFDRPGLFIGSVGFGVLIGVLLTLFVLAMLQ